MSNYNQYTLDKWHEDIMKKENAINSVNAYVKENGNFPKTIAPYLTATTQQEQIAKFAWSTYERIEDELSEGMYDRNYYKKQPLTFEILTDGQLSIDEEYCNIFVIKNTLMYSFNGGPWKHYFNEENDLDVVFHEGDIIKFSGSTVSAGEYDRYSNEYPFVSRTLKEEGLIDGEYVDDPSLILQEFATFNLSGNVMKIFDTYRYSGDGLAFAPCTYMFNESKVVDATDLILDDVPIEPPSVSYMNGYFDYMFSGCSLLTNAPKLTHTDIKNNMYQYMFYECTSLKEAPELPATELADYCYYCMFAFCTSLTAPPELPATALSKYCYYEMFWCSSVTSVPELPATTLANACYKQMFSACTGLTSAPAVLSATTLANNCYEGMFQGCTGLTSAPALPATTLSAGCYSAMFSNCKSLTTPPELPATTLAASCYTSMFNACSSLTTSPVLSAATLTSYCYRNMFSGCTSLRTVTCLATNISASYCTTDWLKNARSSGTFYKASSMSSWQRTTSGVPSGWTLRSFS